jgi:Transcriptional regulators of sugar metabolism
LNGSNELPIDLRRKRILELLAASGRVKVAELSRIFGISEVTIRADLSELENDGMLERVHGGAVSTNKAYNLLSFTERITHYELEKRAIAAAAAKQIADNDTVMINAGTTTFFVAQELKKFQSLKVVTNSVAVADELSSLPNYTVILLGGSYDSRYRFTYGEDALAQLRRYRTDKLILTVDGVSADHGYTTFHHQEAAVCRAMLESGGRSFVVADFSKLGRINFASVAEIDAADCIITNITASPVELEAITEHGVEVIRV